MTNATNDAVLATLKLSLATYCEVLQGILGQPTPAKHAYALLTGPVPEAEDAALDSHMRLLKAHLDRIMDALNALPRAALTALVAHAHSVTGVHAVADARAVARTRSADTPSAPPSDMDEMVDRLALALLDRLNCWPGHAQQLALATARLVEDSAVLHPAARRQRPLGRGFEALFDERLSRRFALLPDHPEQLSALQRNLRILLEEPDQGIAEIEHDLAQPLSAENRAWLEVERRVAMLRFVRKNKAEHGHIRWFLRKDIRHGAVLDRFGIAGHWIVCGPERPTDLAQIGVAAERVLSTRRPINGTGWQIITTADPDGMEDHDLSVSVDDSHLLLLPAPLANETSPAALRAAVRRHIMPAGFARMTPVVKAFAAGRTPVSASATAQPLHRFALRADGNGLALVSRGADSQADLVARVPSDADDDQLLDFLDSVECVLDIATPVDELGGCNDCEAAGWTRALLRIRADQASGVPASARPQKIRLVYVPSSIEHQLGGVPLVGLEFLRDRMERLGARVHVLSIRPDEFDRRLVELLGADVVGIGVYIHNCADVSALVAMLRRAGYAGKIILGGPQLRDIDQIQSSIDGWDALIRGEAEDVLPQVLKVLSNLDTGRWTEALTLARSLNGVAIRHGNAVMLCNTAVRNRADAVICPLPFDWIRGKPKRRLQMNFTRGCPYLCTFCPNHQGQLYRAGPVEELWRFTALAVADDLRLPTTVEREIAYRVKDDLGIDTEPRLRIALHLLLRTPGDAGRVAALLTPLRDFVDPRVRESPAVLDDLVGLSDTLDDHLRGFGAAQLTTWQLKQTWLLAKLSVLASRQLWRSTGNQPDRLGEIDQSGSSPFVLRTSEDNTLVNRTIIREYLVRRVRYGLERDVIFNPGQNTVWDLTDRKGGADEAYIAELTDRNPFSVALGVDGPSNAIIRQNRKPRYGVGEVLAVNRALAGRGVKVANNYILLTPETDLLEAVEAFMLFLLLPVPWRNYGHAINLRVIKEEGTLAHDEGLVFAPNDDGFDVPLRCPELQQLLHRWALTSQVASADIESLLWKILQHDQQAEALVPLVVQRWLRDFDSDAELVALGRLISARSAENVPLTETLRAVRELLDLGVSHRRGIRADALFSCG